ncbi:MAG: sulfite exporter TauE/SafE family protein [Bacteriovoracaceae bacterium]
MEIILFITGLVAGVIDAIAGGGGLITLPVWSLYLGPGAHAIGTNKIVGTLASLTALLVYLKQGKLPWKRGVSFLCSIAVGSFIGSETSPLIPTKFFIYLMLFICPVILFLVWEKEKLFNRKKVQTEHSMKNFIIGGLLCGFYDGFFGPGGGTFMLLTLLFLTDLSLMESLALSKLANTISAGTALVTYSVNGYVHAREGLIMGAGITLGAFIGATLASKKAQNIVRPALMFITVLLFFKLLKEIL